MSLLIITRRKNKRLLRLLSFIPALQLPGHSLTSAWRIPVSILLFSHCCHCRTCCSHGECETWRKGLFSLLWPGNCWDHCVGLPWVLCFQGSLCPAEPSRSAEAPSLALCPPWCLPATSHTSGWAGFLPPLGQIYPDNFSVQASWTRDDKTSINPVRMSRESLKRVFFSFFCYGSEVVAPNPKEKAPIFR